MLDKVLNTQRRKIKEEYYDKLQKVMDETPDSEIMYVYGDMNAKIQIREEDEKDIIGPHVYGRGRNALQTANEDTIENRYLLLDFCRANEMTIMNTYFEKPKMKQCTRKELDTPEWTKPWTPERFSQMDFCLARNRWKNGILDVESHPKVSCDSDHCIVSSKIRIKLKMSQESTMKHINNLGNLIRNKRENTTTTFSSIKKR